MTKANKVKLKGRHIGFRLDPDVEAMLDAELESGKRGDRSDIANAAMKFYLAAPPAVKHAVRYGVPEDMTKAFEELFVDYARKLIRGESQPIEEHWTETPPEVSPRHRSSESKGSAGK